MASYIDVFNDALGQLGQTRITDLDPGSTNNTVILCLTFKDTLRRSTLQDHNWNFATRWEELSPATAIPVSKWAYQYPLPANALRVWRIDEYDSIPWEIVLSQAGVKAVATNQATVTAEITFDVENPDQWSGMFFQAMAAGYAWKLAGPVIGGDTGLKVGREKMIEFLGDPARGILGLLGEAKAIDGQEQSPQQMPHGELVTCRG